MAHEGPLQSEHRTGAVAVEGGPKRRPLWLLLLLLVIALLLLGWLLYALLHKTHHHANTGARKPSAASPSRRGASTAPSTSTPSTSVSPGTANAGSSGSPLAFGAALTGGGGMAARPVTGVEAAAASSGTGATSGSSASGSAAVRGPQGTVLFASNSAAIDPAGLQVIKTAAMRIDVLHPSAVTVTGYTDVVGGQPINNDLSLQRAQAVAAVLRQDLGSATPLVTAIARGKQDPIAPNTTADGRQQNRRASITSS